MAAALSLVDIGPGKLSLDAALGIEKSGPGWALAAAGGGVAGAVGAHLLAEANTPASQESTTASAPEAMKASPAAGASEDVAAAAASNAA